MQAAHEDSTPVKAKAVLVDPKDMTVLWMNESAAEAASSIGGTASNLPAAELAPITASLGLETALRAAADTGVPQHLRADLLSAAKGSVAVVTSIYRLPDGLLLLLTEQAWLIGEKVQDRGPSHRSRWSRRP